MQSHLSKQRKPSESASVNDCILNIAPVLFEDKRVEVTVLDYEDDEKFNALRNELRGAYFVRRDRGTRIVCVSLDPDASGISGKTETIQLGENLRLCAGLVRETLIEYANRVGRPSTKHDPVMIFGGKNLLTECMPPGMTLPSWLHILTRYHASPFVLKRTREHFTLAMALDVRTSRQITASCSELAALGFPLEGLYVGTYKSGHDPRLSPIFSLAGRILSVSGDDLLLEDYGGGSDSVKTDVMFLEPSLTAFEHCLSHLFGDKSVAIKAALDKHLSESRNGPGRLDKLEKCRQNISSLNLELIPGVPFTLDPFLAEGEKTFPRMADAPKTIYVLDPTGNHTDTWHDRGLNSYGPYTANSFTPNTPNICVICQRNYRGRVEQFIHKLWNGIQVSGSTKPVFAKGMVRKYALDGVNIEFFDTQDDTADAYRKAILQAISSQEERGQKWHLALIQTQERFHDLHGDDNPYLVSKAALMTHQVPSQEFEIETTAGSDYQLGYVLNNMALAMYAKLGGIPWLLKANPTIAHELVFGLGSASVGSGRLGDRERVVGITTVFTGDGYYWLSNVSKAVPFEEYRAELLSSLRSVIRKVQSDMNWRPKEHVRLVFHAFKPFKDAEAEAVKAVMQELGDYDVDYAFVHIVENHPYLLIDKSQQGIYDYQTKKTKGVFAPLRGKYLSLSDYESLVVLTGARDVKRPEDGLPSPILLRLHRSSSFHDMTYLTRQVFSFSNHSWRSFFPAPKPVTVLYSELVAKMLGQLAQVSRWNPDVLVGRAGSTRWYL